MNDGPLPRPPGHAFVNPGFFPAVFVDNAGVKHPDGVVQQDRQRLLLHGVQRVVEPALESLRCGVVQQKIGLLLLQCLQGRDKAFLVGPEIREHPLQVGLGDHLEKLEF